jgi:hypothetical protein
VTTGKASLRGVTAIAVRTTRRHWRTLFVVALAIFVPVGLLEVLDHRLAEVDPEVVTTFQLIEIGFVGSVHALTALVGEIFFAGVIAAAVSETHGGRAPSLRELLRTVPYLTILAIDLLFALGLAVGLILLIVPGVIFFAYFAPAAPVAKIEHLGVRAAFTRSRELVRGRTGLVLAVLVPVALAGQVLSGVAVELGGETFLGEWAGATIAEMLAGPLWALGAVAVTYELIATEPKPGGTRSGQPVAASS